MNRRLLYTGLLMVFPVGAFGAPSAAYALAAFEALEQERASEPSAVRRSKARSDAQPKAPAPIPAPRVGDSVLAPAGQGEWIYPGVVIAEPTDGAVEIVFEDGDHGKVEISSLRPIPRAGISVEASVYRDGRWSEPETCSPWRGSASYPDVTLALMRFSPDDAPQGPLTRLELDTWFRYQGKGAAYPATIVTELSTRFAVVYADGDHELAKHDAQTLPPPIGATLEVRAPSGEPWERGTLRNIEGRALEVELAGVVQWVPPARVRWPGVTGGCTVSAGTRGWKGFLKAVPFFLLFGFLSVVYLLTPMAAPAMTAVVEPERFDWLFGGYPKMLLASDPGAAQMLGAGDDVLIGVLVVAGLLFTPLIVLTFMRLVWLPAIWLWGELEDQMAAGILGFVKVGVAALLPFIIALGFAFVLGGSTRGAIAYGGCTLFLPQVLCVLLGMTTTELTRPSRGGLLHVLANWVVAIPLCVPAYLCIFVLEPSPVWWAVEHIAMLVELVILFRVLGNDREGKTLFES